MNRPTLVYDDDCGFCTWWSEFFARRSTIRVVGFSEVTEELRERLPENYEECSHLVTEDEVYSCGASMEAAFVRSDVGERARPLVETLRRSEGYNRIRERLYRTITGRRSLWGRLLSEEPPAGRRTGDE